MKRGKDEGRSVGPMFPRLHVNDTEKGGPRAPPRNKMALYEQLSIPSQRFNSTANLAPSSSSQEIGHERVMNVPLDLPPSTHSSEKRHGRYSDLGAPPVHLEEKNLDEDDFMVPIFVHTGMPQNSTKTNQNMDREKHSSFGSSITGRPAKFQNSSDKEPVKSGSNQSSREKVIDPPNKTNSSLNQEHKDHHATNFSRLQNSDSCLQQVHRGGTHPNNFALGHDVSIENGNSLISRRKSCQDKQTGPGNIINHNGNCEDTTSGSLQRGHMDGNDDVSEASMVDSLSGLDISPDDVVGIIGQKHFWKARKAIVNQQRAFAVQVFELHRLIEVQRLIAESPNRLIEENAFLGKSIKVSPVKKLPLDYIVIPPPQNVKQRDDSEKPNHTIDVSAENAVGKTAQALSSMQNYNYPSNYGAFSGNPPPTSVTTDPRMAPWCFPQSPGQQWLIPVMSPSEGLIYKPYPGPGFMGPACGSYGSTGSTPVGGDFVNPAYGGNFANPAYGIPPPPSPMGGNFVNSAYGVPPSHQYHGMGVPLVGHGYYHPFMSTSVSASTGEQTNNFVGPGSQGHPTQHFNTQNQTSCNVPSQRNRDISHVRKHVSIGSEVQGSTASSPSETAQAGSNQTSEGVNALPLFPTSPALHVPEGEPRPVDTDTDTDTPVRVIKVVPHNARSATESAARRIFKSIQEERKHYDSV